LTKHATRLRLADPAAPIPDNRAEITRALLQRYARVLPVISDEMPTFLGWRREQLDEIERAPRRPIGRLTEPKRPDLRQGVVMADRWRAPAAGQSKWSG
jgi:hypothetical protein